MPLVQSLMKPIQRSYQKWAIRFKKQVEGLPKGSCHRPTSLLNRGTKILNKNRQKPARLSTLARQKTSSKAPLTVRRE